MLFMLLLLCRLLLTITVEITLNYDSGMTPSWEIKICGLVIVLVTEMKLRESRVIGRQHVPLSLSYTHIHIHARTHTSISETIYKKLLYLVLYIHKYKNIQLLKLYF